MLSDGERGRETDSLSGPPVLSETGRETDLVTGPAVAVPQDLSLVHFSAQRKRFQLDRGMH